MTDEIAFKDLGNIEIPDKGDVKTEKIVAEVERKIAREQIEGVVRQDTGTEPEKKGTLTKDVPQAAFRIMAGIIDCQKFMLTDDEAAAFAANLNILIPVEGKIAALMVLILITLNKVWICMDAIKLKFGRRGSLEEIPKKEKLPEPIR